MRQSNGLFFSTLTVVATTLSTGCANSGGTVPAPARPPIPASAQAIANPPNAPRMIAVSGTIDGDVEVVDASGRIVEDLSGFASPQGLASDPKGDLYIADMGNNRIQIYSPGLKGSPKTLSDPGQYPISVASYGNGKVVAALNQMTTGYGPGSVTIYIDGVARAPITNAKIATALFGAFDAQGNLYVDFSTKGSCPCIARIANAAKGGVKLTMLTTSNSIDPAGIQVTNTGQIAILDYGNTVYTYNPPVHGSLGSPVATTTLDGVGTSGAFAFTKDMRDLYTVNYNDNGTVFEYAYPAGGASVSSFEDDGSYPFGVAVFPAQYPH